ncbi:hypothetical protein BGHDH14_bgh02437 [Blumeria hordei DH14]|uniref:Uncharacterized protein n=1 Tax=Blumeria graminis f. sp. hordei (strain DH14) TaxID=546991 RepID=N1JHM3_BLUG1|nr:hypothetical protein BGHDH14_bgh02437 [Blumeria hordei DH14]
MASYGLPGPIPPPVLLMSSSPRFFGNYIQWNATSFRCRNLKH